APSPPRVSMREGRGMDMRSRRGFLTTALGAWALAPSIMAAAQRDARATVVMTKEQRDSLTPDQVLEALKTGNARFRSGDTIPRDYHAERHATVSGQFPAAVILGCIDSRAPAEILFDAGIGDTFNARVAGNVVNDDLLGSLEFACDVAGAKVILLLGHTVC